MAKLFLLMTAVSGFLAVMLGAFGAHVLRSKLEDDLFTAFQTGVHYQFFHTFALGIVGILLMRGDDAMLRYAGWFFVGGTLLFSGSLYALALTGVRTIGAITPIGGVCLLAGWGILAVAVIRATQV